MFNNNKKTVGIFINRAELPLQHNFCKSVISESENYDYNIIFFAAYELMESKNSSESEVPENIIVNFAPVERLDVCIILSSTFTGDAQSNIVKALKDKCKCPVISFKESQSGFYNILSGEDRGAGTLVRHLYSVHNARKICFFADQNAFRENLRRETYYRDSMEDCGLPVEESYIFRSNTHDGRGDEAYEYFFVKMEHHPDAVICADDNLARELCNALIQHGIKVPRDTMVCGFNDSYEAREFVPRITTVSADLEEMASETMKMVDDLIQGRPRGKRVTVPEQMIYRESCGCLSTDQSDIEEYTRSHYRRLDSIEEKHVQYSMFNVYLDGCDSFAEIKNIIKENLYLLGDVDEFYLCLLGKKDGVFRHFSNEISSDAQLELAFKDGDFLSDESLVFPQKDLLPDAFKPESEIDDLPKIYYISLLHNRDKIFGYTALNFKNPIDQLNFFYHDWNVTIGLAINEYFSNLYLKELLRKNEENSVTDYLTQMPNRRGLNRYVKDNWAKWEAEHAGVCFMTLDLDGLKYINDTFGHEEGDWAISTMAEFAKDAFKDYGIAARTGGDEFVAVFCTDLDTIKKIESTIYEQIADVNELSGKNFPMGVSIGYHYTNIDENSSYEECIKLSDVEMYKVKQAHKNAR